MVIEIVKNNNIERALRNFKKKIKDSGLMIELKNRTFYEKPSIVKRRKKKKSELRSKLN